jgi:hypothetical protein
MAQLTFNCTVNEAGAGTSSALIGADGITIISGSNTTTVSGFRSEFVSASGSLQTQINGISVTSNTKAILGDSFISVNSGTNTVQLVADAIIGGTNVTVVSGTDRVTISATGGGSTANAVIGDPFISVNSGTNTTQLVADAITGSDGITVISGSNAVSLTGFRTEFVNASGSLQTQINSNSTLQGVYNNSTTGMIQTTVGKPVVISGTIGTRALTVSGHQQSGGNISADKFYLNGGGEFGKRGTDAILTGSGTASTLTIAAYDSTNASRYAGTAGNVKLAHQVIFDGTGNLSNGTNRFVYVPTTVVQSGEAAASNVCVGFDFEPIVTINSAQVFTVNSAFITLARVRETAAITSAHTLFQQVGFSSGPVYSVGHNATTTAKLPHLCAFAANPRAFRETTFTGTTIVDYMTGFATNPTDPFRTNGLFGTKQINTGITVNRYSHFVAFSDVLSSGLINEGTLTHEVGLDLQNINIGTTTTSIYSNSTTADMRHKGSVLIGDTGNSSVVLNGITQPAKLVIVNDGEFLKDTIYAKYDNANANNYVLARALGTKAVPLAVANGTIIASFQTFGYDGTSFRQGAFWNSKVDMPVATNDVPSGFDLQVRRKTAGSAATALELHSNSVLDLSGRLGYSLSSVLNAGLNADQNNYDPEGVTTSGAPQGFWRIQPNTTNRTITGILAPAAPSAGVAHMLTIVNVDAANSLILANQSASSTSIHRIITGTGANLTLTPDQCANLIYDTTTLRWRVISRNF